MRKLVLLGVGAAVVAVGVTLGFVFTGGSDVEPGVIRTSAPLPRVAGPTLDGGEFAPADYAGKPLVVNFWNPYCTPCRTEATILDLAHGHLGDRAVIVGVLYSNNNFPHDMAAARRFARELGEQFPTIDDPDHAIARLFDIRGIPATVIADGRGRIRFEVLGKLKAGQVERLVRRVTRT